MYIPQYTNKTASLNIAVAGSIIFHHFASKYIVLNLKLTYLVWAGYEETPMYHEKFQLQDKEEKKGPAFKLNVTVNPTSNEENVQGEKDETQDKKSKDVEDLDEFFE